LRQSLDPEAPSAVDAELARESSRLLDAVPLHDGTINVALEGGRREIPLVAAKVLLKVLADMGRGNAVTTVALVDELTPTLGKVEKGDPGVSLGIYGVAHPGPEYPVRGTRPISGTMRLPFSLKRRASQNVSAIRVFINPVIYAELCVQNVFITR
jgi:hypothetical protein